MKFVKGMVIGSIVSAGIIMLCNENMNVNKIKAQEIKFPKTMC